jgi:hypothetical protein
MTDEVERKQISVSLEVHEFLTLLKRNKTIDEAVRHLARKAGYDIPKFIEENKDALD